ncbi:2-C-methyl-D-erythritol 2,4-cyclodiphosphate synthase [Tepidiforma flava]|uniref:2-C-methyl-D-erythritol 2,4-cyclodiphosphate synthase n=1 Tax=Tepidiforma flava TaxID=3004094 RepID=A0ABY7M6U8_9CHLR|nr:2-C-methyl-D-erythritol 2,4-cyclodiphosphate synthase [Tepidiforma flava]WBL35358.1 2-C-methyl-D-erythritol 2,4-cyclodiphosphate synthase [Tepidiforma flava]
MSALFRVGIGEDLHPVDDSRHLILGGVIIEEGPGLRGHSDADVLLHAITDAVLGAAALGDIGQHFPPGDPRYAHADSADFLRTALRLARDAGWHPGNIDAVIRAERPRLEPYIPHIRERIAAIAGLDPAAVSVKAKTGEGLDAVGRGEAMAAVAVVLLYR